jgi:PAS domain-containing protein
VLLIVAVLFSGLVALQPYALSGVDAIESSYRGYAVRDMTANADLFALSLSFDSENRRVDDLAALARRASAGSETRFTVTGRIILVNRAMQEILGLSREAKETRLEEIPRNAELLDAIRETADSGESLERELRAGRDAGGESFVQAYTATLPCVGGGGDVLVVLRDVLRLR